MKYLAVDSSTVDWLNSEEGQGLIKAFNTLADKLEARAREEQKPQNKKCISCGAPYADPMPCGH
jgi:hypothetical protein